ncbi:MAG TPA: hypothetical protein ENJ19_00595 [Gammaproteobacteria bacterium]|nr:hypothetical protein [Gammaproteobacteria bacterium]
MKTSHSGSKADHRQPWTTLLAALLAAMGTVHAAPGTLATSPLFLSTAVEPNVQFLLDNSGSMEWDLLVQDGTSGLPDIGGWTGNYYILPSANNGLDEDFGGDHPYVTPDEDSVAGAWRTRNHNYNTLYYNPNVTYQPWPGVDSSGNALYNDANPSAAPVDPDNPGGATLNLTANTSFWNFTWNDGWYWETIFPAYYFTWTDSDGDGVVDESDVHTKVEIVPATATYSGSAARSDCAAAPICTYAEEIQNFANWYTYYRKRSYVAKAAIGNVVNATSAKRMGLHVYNGGLERDLDTMSDSSVKTGMLSTVYNLDIPCTWTTCPGTPARNALETVGEYFENDADAIFSESDGGACQQNFSVVISDGYWNGWDPGVGNADGDDSSAFDGAPYADAVAETLGDVAMLYYETDLKPGLDDIVPTITGVDEAEHQHMVTFAVAFGVAGTLDPATQDPTDAEFSWPDPTDAFDEERVDDLWHAAYNGRGKFLSAQNPAELTDGLVDALAAITDRAGSAAAVAFNSTSLNTTSSVFLALFNSEGWSGDLSAYPLDAVTGEVQSTALWQAATELDARNISSTPRVILSYDGSQGIPFQWDNLTTAQQNDLRTNANGGTDSEALGQSRLDFIRGDRSNEGTGNNFRVRASRLGDVVHAGPVHVGKPELNWPAVAPFPTGAGERYFEFRSAQADRQGVVYIGANDGMLHGFDSDTGEEVLAYIPASLFSTDTSGGLHYLADPGYTHRYYVDLTPVVSDAYIAGPGGSTAAWRSVLIGGLRGGGRGYFALDVTNPNLFDESNADQIVMWEFTSADDADLGYSFSTPTIAMMANDRWAAVFGNGYNDSGSGEAQLFIVYLDGGLDGSWTEGDDYIKISTEVGSSSDRNGLSTPAVVDLDGDGVAERIYAGDIKGNLWAFDVDNSNDSKWKVAYKLGSTPKPLFIAGSTQPITSPPVVVRHSDEPGGTSNEPDTLVLFGTGQYLVDADKSNTDTQAFYGVWDHGKKELEISDLKEQEFLSGFPADMRVSSDYSVAYDTSGSGQEHGWYINLPSPGERMVTHPIVRGDIVYFNTLIPSTDACTFGGSGWLMSLNYKTGARPDDAVFDYNNDGLVDDNDLLSSSSLSNVAASGQLFDQGLPASPAVLGDRQYTAGTKTDSGDDINDRAIERLPSTGTGRLSWTELEQ